MLSLQIACPLEFPNHTRAVHPLYINNSGRSGFQSSEWQALYKGKGLRRPKPSIVIGETFPDASGDDCAMFLKSGEGLSVANT